VLGISEYKPNVFAVAVGNFSASTVTGTAGSWSIWSLDLSAFSVTANKITTIPAAEFLNGVTTITSREIVLAADSAQGVIYRVDAAAGTWTVAFDDLALKPNMTATYQIGVNGIVVHGSYLYFDNSGNVWLATNPSRQIVKISPAGAVTVEAGNLQDTTLKGCTSLQFGRTASDRHVLYVNVNGAGGKLLAADIFG
jgi:hypothetical protein